MGDETAGKPRAAASPRSVLTSDEVHAFAVRATRARVSVAVPCVPAGASEAQLFEAELVNISRSGMFLATGQLLDVGAIVDFAFKLDDGLLALRGSAEVVRQASQDTVGMGLRFVALDESGQELVSRLIEASLGVPEGPVMDIDSRSGAVSAGRVSYDHGSIRVVLSPATKHHFTKNPLLHIGVGGCFLPALAEVPLGTGYQLDIVDGASRLLLRCKARVAAKQDRQIGLRLVDVDRAALQALRAEIAKLPGA
jgi:PilZ domain